MRKYRGFIKASFLEVFAFRFDIWSWIVQDILTVICTVFLWLAIYAQQDSGVSISGYKEAELIGYMVFISLSLTWSGATNTFRNVGDDIYQGNIANSLTKPIHYRRWQFFNAIGQMLANFTLFFLPMLVVSALFLQLIFASNGGLGAIFSSFSWWNVPFYLIARLLALVITDSLDFIIAQLSFLTKSVFGLMIIKSTIFAFLSGGMIPFSFFPKGVQEALAYLPFASLASTPVNLLLGRYSLTSSVPLQNAWFVLGLSALYAIALYAASEMACAKMIRHVESAGG